MNAKLILLFLGALFWFGLMYYLYNTILVDELLTVFPGAQNGPYWGLMFVLWNGMPFFVAALEAIHMLRKSQARGGFQ